MTDQAHQIESPPASAPGSTPGTPPGTPGSNSGISGGILSGISQSHERLAVACVGNVVHITFPAQKADGVAVRELYELAAQLTDRFHTRVVIDFAGTPYVPSGMMGMLVTVKKKICAAGGQLHVVVPDPLAYGAFTAMRLERILTLFPALPEAMAGFKA